MDINLHNGDSCKYKAIDMTFTHIAQSDISIFFRKDIKKTLKWAILNGRLSKNLFAMSILVMLRTKELCEDIKPKLIAFVEELDLGKQVFQNEILIEKLKKQRNHLL